MCAYAGRPGFFRTAILSAASLALLCPPLAAQGPGSPFPPQRGPGNPLPAKEVRTDSSADFVRYAAEFDMLQMSLGHLAATQGGDPRVKALGDAILMSRSLAFQQLMLLVETKDLQIPAQLGPAREQTYEQAKKLHGTAFDAFYLNTVATLNQQALDAYYRQWSFATVPEVGKFASRMTPDIEIHRQAALRLLGKAAGTRTPGQPAPASAPKPAPGASAPPAP